MLAITKVKFEGFKNYTTHITHVNLVADMS
jgi:hypothetical protein